MPGHISLLGFIAASLVVLLIPVHVAGATVGLSAILLTSATAFGVVKALGVGTLLTDRN